MRLRASKYCNQILNTDEGKFHSKREYLRWRELQLLQSQGLISDLERQVKFDLIVNEKKIGRYTADFVYKDPVTGKMIIDDSKGFKTREWKRTKKLVEALFPEYEVIES